MKSLPKTLLAVLTAVFITGCSIGVTVHDEDRAAELAKQFLSQTVFSEKVRNAYDIAHPKLKQSISYEKLEKHMSTVRSVNKSCAIDVVGYEIYGGQEALAVYSESQCDQPKLYYRLTFIGTKSNDYKLVDFKIEEFEIKKTDLYREYSNKLTIKRI